MAKKSTNGNQTLTSSELDSVEQELYDHVEDVLCANDVIIGNIVVGMLTYADGRLALYAKELRRIESKLNKFVQQKITAISNDLESAITVIATDVENRITHNEWIITQIAVKSGVLPVGQPLHADMFKRGTIERTQNLFGVMRLDMGHAEPAIMALLEVLASIRDSIANCCAKCKEVEIATPTETSGDDEEPIEGGGDWEIDDTLILPKAAPGTEYPEMP